MNKILMIVVALVIVGVILITVMGNKHDSEHMNDSSPINTDNYGEHGHGH
tara:strand:- start:39178 stop:39327 length:150 start_codon:yes stop_codon:yes gene_type:complete